jgi:voltage-gated potassium channel
MRKRNLRLLHQLFRSTGVNKIMAVYLGYFLLAAGLILVFEPGIQSFGDSLWYCFAAATTIGFGDVTAVTLAGRIVTVILSVYSVAVVAIITAVITGFFMDVVKGNAKESAEHFLDELEHLPSLSEEELKDLSVRVKKFRKKTE